MEIHSQGRSQGIDRRLCLPDISVDPSVLQGGRILHLTSHKLSCSVFCSLQQMRHITFHYKPPFLALYTAGSQAAGDITL